MIAGQGLKGHLKQQKPFVLQKDSRVIFDETSESVLKKCEQKVYFHLERVELSGTYNEGSGLGEFDMHRTCYRQEGQGKTVRYLTSL